MRVIVGKIKSEWRRLRQARKRIVGSAYTLGETIAGSMRQKIDRLDLKITVGTPRNTTNRQPGWVIKQIRRRRGQSQEPTTTEVERR